MRCSCPAASVHCLQAGSSLLLPEMIGANSSGQHLAQPPEFGLYRVAAQCLSSRPVLYQYFAGQELVTRSEKASR
jgi:hypothetical protein